MAYTSGTISSANPAADLYAALETLLTAHANWDFVETVTLGGQPYQVWKNRGTGAGANAFGQDYYISINYTPVGGVTLSFKVFEVWDAVNKKAIRPCKHTLTVTPNANGSWGDEVNGYALDSASLTWAGPSALITTGFQYNLWVTKDQIWAAGIVGGTEFTMGLGVFESYYPGGDPFPLFLMRGPSQSYIGSNFGSTAVGYGTMAWSRHPTVTVAQTYNLMGELTRAGWQIGGISSTENDRFHGGKVLRGYYNVNASSSALPRSAYGYIRGRLIDVVDLDQQSTSKVGDTVTLDGSVYITMYVASNNGTARRAYVLRDAA